ncbi:M14 family metallocarboxypeptidase [Vibrio sp. SS-MA-C1-2]|uniref:M14 family metallopeptidase n=1 Tax=Vibrio sp. SS-MA-C1-2 TaxID=2908646 RepID=UPI001F2D3678|nr:M14 family metallocarboxypeptidase [Vibrio sp. SS-MA-C1-2]UJF20041.1 M14 family metallocarboxypeptidase [Vibrio sp. SS-MA-C1-2]
MTQTTYLIGTPGQVWQDKEKQQWLAQTTIKRSYLQEVVTKITALADKLDVQQHGALSYSPEKYPLFVIKSKNWDNNKPTVLITGGVHGYETSGVHGALLFLNDEINNYLADFNFIAIPCVSPWGYEVINRWNPQAIDPNRSFYDNTPSEESAAVMELVKQHQNANFIAHIDLHETTDTDESEFRPALAARDGIEYVAGSIPDGFYGVGDTENPQHDFQTAIIDEVRQVTHIAPADAEGEIIGSAITQEGVINYPLKALSLCASVTDATYTCTTEVYPDSPKVTDDECNQAQVAALRGALNYILQNK